MAAERYWTAPKHVVHTGEPTDHPHGPSCGCRSIQHAGQHVDYLVNGHAHHAHEGHWDECDPAVFDNY